MKDFKEIRNRTITVLAVFTFSFIVGLWQYNKIFNFLMQLAPPGINLILSSPMASVMVIMNVAFLVAFVVTMPVLIYNVFKFVTPAMYLKEKSLIKKSVPASIALFFLGVTINYFGVLKFGLPFMAKLGNSLGTPILWDIQQFIQFIVLSTLVAGILFQFPMLIHGAIRLNIVTAQQLSKYRLHVLITCIILASFLTPTTDAITMLFMATPMYLLYEGVLFVNKQSLEVNATC